MSDQNCLSEQELIGFHSGLLKEDQADVVAAHLEECPVCEETLNCLEQQSEQQSDTLIEQLRHGVTNKERSEDDLDDHCRQVVASLEKLPVRGASPDAHRFERTCLISTSDDSLEAGSDIPLQLRDYRLQEKIGEGGMGTVYKAIHTKLDKELAIKILPAERLRETSSIERFQREMRAVGKLNDPHIVQATDAGEVDGTHFLVMEYVDGEDLSTLLKQRGPFRIADACEIIR